MKPANRYTVAFWSLLILSWTTDSPIWGLVTASGAVLAWLFEHFEERYEDG